MCTCIHVALYAVAGVMANEIISDFIKLLIEVGPLHLWEVHLKIFLLSLSTTPIDPFTRLHAVQMYKFLMVEHPVSDV